ncbi:hypothetical protein E2I00_009311, partial [Balaenoptera physalus]
APDCTWKSTQSDLAFFRFPRDPARCQKWVENCRRADLEDKTPDQLNKHYRLCAKHFETSMICRTSPYRTVLRDNAIPTIFDLTSHLNNPHKGGEEQDEGILPLTLEEKENKEYLKSLGKQNTPLDGHEADEIPEGLFTPDNFQALLECQINSGEEVLRKCLETTAVNTLFCSKTQQKRMLEEFTNLATKLDILMKLPGKFPELSTLTSASYYKESLSVPTVEHIIQELKDILSEQHLKALKCLSLVPSVMGQLKFNTSEEHSADTHRTALLENQVEHRGKDIELPSTIYEALHLADIKFFPKVYALLKVLCILPVMKVESERYENGSRNLASLNTNFNIKHNLDLMVDTYIKLYTSKSELPTDNSETTENT